MLAKNQNCVVIQMPIKDSLLSRNVLDQWKKSRIFSPNNTHSTLHIQKITKVICTRAMSVSIFFGNRFSGFA